MIMALNLTLARHHEVTSWSTYRGVPVDRASRWGRHAFHMRLVRAVDVPAGSVSLRVWIAALIG